MMLPAISCGESPTDKEKVCFCIRSLTPPQAAGNTLAVQFTTIFLVILSVASVKLPAYKAGLAGALPVNVSYAFINDSRSPLA
jgi:hypothetical protein